MFKSPLRHEHKEATELGDGSTDLMSGSKGHGLATLRDEVRLLVESAIRSDAG